MVSRRSYPGEEKGALAPKLKNIFSSELAVPATIGSTTTATERAPRAGWGRHVGVSRGARHPDALAHITLA